jgi:hypothetical protein
MPQRRIEGIEEYQIEKKIISQMAKEAMQPGVWFHVSQPIRIFESDKPSNVSFRDAKFGITLWSLGTPLNVVDLARGADSESRGNRP